VKLCDRLQLPVARAAYHLTDIERRARMASGVDSLAGMAPDACPPVRPWALASQEDARRGRRRARRLSRRW
jgi:hypothetical protein